MQKTHLLISAFGGLNNCSIYCCVSIKRIEEVLCGKKPFDRHKIHLLNVSELSIERQWMSMHFSFSQEMSYGRKSRCKTQIFNNDSILSDHIGQQLFFYFCPKRCFSLSSLCDSMGVCARPSIRPKNAADISIDFVIWQTVTHDVSA